VDGGARQGPVPHVYKEFYGTVRSSELVGIRWEHLHFPRRGGEMVFIPTFKTDQGGEGAWVYIPTAKGGEGAPVDIVAALQQLKKMQGCSGYARETRLGGI
jgi:hypothetical protein